MYLDEEAIRKVEELDSEAIKITMPVELISRAMVLQMWLRSKADHSMCREADTFYYQLWLKVADIVSSVMKTKILLNKHTLKGSRNG